MPLVHHSGTIRPDGPSGPGRRDRSNDTHPTLRSLSGQLTDRRVAWELAELFSASDAPELLHDVLLWVSRVLGADEVSLFAGQSPPALVAVHGRRVLTEPRRVVDRRLLHAAGAGGVVALAASDPAEGWQVDRRTVVRAGLWVPGPLDAATPTVVRALRVDAEPFPRDGVRLLTVVARRLAGVVHRMHEQRFDEARDAVRAHLLTVSTAIATDLDFEAVARRVVGGVTAVTDFAAATVEIRRDDTVRRAAARGDGLVVGDRTPLERWTSASDDDLRVGELTYRVALADARPVDDPSSTQRATPGLVIRLPGRDGEVLGFLTLSRPRTGAEPTPEMVRTVELFARLTQVAMVNADLHRGVRRQREVARSLLRVTAAVADSQEAEEILTTCCEAADGHTTAERATVFVIDDHGLVRHSISCGRDSDVPPAARQPQPLHECALLADAARAAEPVVVDDVAGSTRFATAWSVRTLGLRSVAVHALRADDTTVGLLLVDTHTHVARFDEPETLVLSQIATQAAVALRQSSLHTQRREQAARNAQLLELTTAMTATFEFEAIFARIVEAVRSRMDGDSVSVLRVGPSTLQALGTTAGDRLRCPRPPLDVPVDDDLAAALRTLWTDPTVRLDDIRTDDVLSRIAMPSTRGIVLAAPHDRDGTDVVLAVGSHRTAAFTAADERFLADLAQVTKLAVRNAELFDEVAEAARRDPLTGLLNRRAFWEVLQARLDRLPPKTPLGVAVIDADDFKHINDQLGHAAGDVALRHIAARLRRAVRSADAVFRIGGEEFTVVLPGADDREARAVMERVRTAVRSDADDVAVSVSIGVAVAPRDGLTADALFGEADRALLQAKRQGKNRIVLRSEV